MTGCWYRDECKPLLYLLLEKALTLLFASAQLHVAPFLYMQPVLVIYHCIFIKEKQQQNPRHWNFKCFSKGYQHYTQVYPSHLACMLKGSAPGALCCSGLAIQACLQWTQAKTGEKMKKETFFFFFNGFSSKLLWLFPSFSSIWTFLFGGVPSFEIINLQWLYWKIRVINFSLDLCGLTRMVVTQCKIRFLCLLVVVCFFFFFL